MACDRFGGDPRPASPHRRPWNCRVTVRAWPVGIDGRSDRGRSAGHRWHRLGALPSQRCFHTGAKPHRHHQGTGRLWAKGRHQFRVGTSPQPRAADLQSPRLPPERSERPVYPATGPRIPATAAPRDPVRSQARQPIATRFRHATSSHILSWPGARSRRGFGPVMRTTPPRSGRRSCRPPSTPDELRQRPFAATSVHPAVLPHQVVAHKSQPPPRLAHPGLPGPGWRSPPGQRLTGPQSIGRVSLTSVPRPTWESTSSWPCSRSARSLIEMIPK